MLFKQGWLLRQLESASKSVNNWSQTQKENMSLERESFNMKVGDKIKDIYDGRTGIILAIAPEGFIDAERGLIFRDSDGVVNWTYQYMCEVLND